MIRKFSSVARAAYPFRLSLLGVPEQVNIPIKLCLEHGIFEKYGVDLEYKSVREGTGAMMKRLSEGEADLAITVTDGFIAGKALGANVALVGTYVESPLTWAVCAHPNSKLESISDFFNIKKSSRTIGISRLHSGSHTMSYYLNHLYGSGAHAESLNFKVLGGLEELTRGIHNGDADIFLWEVFTTKPSFRSGELKYIGEVSTPWPAFSIVAPSSAPSSLEGSFRQAPLLMTDPAFAHMYRHRFLPALAEGVQMFKQQHQQPDSALSWLDGVSSPCHQSEGTAHKSVLCRGNDDIITGGGSGNRNSSIDRIVREFGHTVEDAVQWMQKTRYALPDMSVDVTQMQLAVQVLQEAGLVQTDPFPVSRLWGGEANLAVALRNHITTPTQKQRQSSDAKEIWQLCGEDLSGW